ncbi:MAG TPA: hypothetical protein VKA48_11790 [Gammaproteobacteria bacterium]|nr:hypothetical protein [Gammaproteobacteria bacterium]
MRKINLHMLRAIDRRKDWCERNTCVEVAQHVGNPYLIASVYLFGNHIADIVPPEGERQEDRPGMRWEAQPNVETFRLFPTATTRSRLRALGVDAYIEDRKPHIDGEPA